MLTRMSSPALTIGVSLKMYFGHTRTIAWARTVAGIAREHEDVMSGAVDLFVIPTFPSLVPVRAELEGTRVHLGAQDIAWADEGPFTGEVSGRELREIDCDLVEIGHAERRRLFGESDRVVADKVQAAFRNALTPLICVGELRRESRAATIEEVTRQLGSALAAATEAGRVGPVIVAYEPAWAIGAAAPADDGHIVAILAGVSDYLAGHDELRGSRAIYGGSAGPGLLTRTGGRIGGLFLGRSAHDPEAVRTILDEAGALLGKGSSW